VPILRSRRLKVWVPSVQSWRIGNRSDDTLETAGLKPGISPDALRMRRLKISAIRPHNAVFVGTFGFSPKVVAEREGGAPSPGKTAETLESCRSSL